MGTPYLMIYVFTTFVVGFSCLGAVVVVARRRPVEPVRAFVVFYTALTILVFARLGHVVFDALADRPPAGLVAVFQYAESFVGRYGLMFALPYFVHRVFGVRGRDALFLAITLVTAAGQHLTEYVLPEPWDPRGDVIEDVLLAGVLAYTIWLAIARRRAPGVHQPLASRFLVLLVLGVPGSVYDLFLSEGSDWRLYPLWYCILSVGLTVTLVAGTFSGPRSIPAGWGLSEREEDVVRLMRRGLSNADIARELTISTNTVKTHVRAIYDKSGVRTRAALVAALADASSRAVAGARGGDDLRPEGAIHPNG